MSDVGLPDFGKTIYPDYPDWQRCRVCNARGTVEVKLTTSDGRFVIGYDVCRVCEGNGGWSIER